MDTYGLLGYPLGHSFSKNYFNEKFEGECIQAEYKNFEIPDIDDFPEVLMGNRDLKGFNVTIPYKQKIIPFLDELSEEAREIGAVNVVRVTRRSNGNFHLKGYNADYLGFMNSIAPLLRPHHKKALILGTGGASKAIHYTLHKKLGLETVFVSRYQRPGTVSYKDLNAEAVAEYEVIVNCTPVGRYPDLGGSPLAENKVSVRMFSDLELAIDLIYNPYRTKFLQDAKRLTRCNTKSGMDMMIVQAIDSLNIWCDRETDPEDTELMLRKIKRKLLESQLNVVAIGLPGSGKTTIFRRYAYELGRRFIDIDEETEELMGLPAAEVLSDYGLGEEYIRAMEHEAVKKAAATRGTVIATGGSTMLNPLNRDLLKANGILIYVKRPLEMLNIKGKPLSVNIDMTKVFNDRDRIYRRTADMVLLNSRIFGEIKARTGEGNSYNYELKGFVYFIARKVQKYLNELAADIWT